MKNIKDLWKRSFVYLASFALSMTCASQINKNIEKSRIEDFKKTQKTLCLGVKTEMEHKFQEISSSLEIIAKSKNTSTLLEEKVSDLIENDKLFENTKDSKYIDNNWNNELLDHLKIHGEFVDGFYVINKDGICLARMYRRTGRVGADFKDRKSISKIINENYKSLLFAERNISLKDKIPSITFTYPYFKNNKLEVITRAIIYSDVLSSRFLRNHEGYNFSVRNDDNYIIADTHFRHIGTKDETKFLHYFPGSSLENIISEKLNYAGANLKISITPDSDVFKNSVNTYQYLIYSIFSLISLVGIGGSEIYNTKKKFEKELIIQKKLKDKLKTNEKRIKDLLELLPEGVFYSDANLNPVYANQKCLSMFGYTFDEVKEFNSFFILHPKDIARAKENVARRIKGEKFGAQEYTAIRKDKSIFPALFNSTTIIRDGKIDGIMAVVMDITEKKKMEEKYIQSQKMDSIGNLSAGIAHDFNNILTAIKGYSSFLIDDESDPQKKEYLEEILSAANRSQELTKNLLGYARKGQNKIESININKIVEEVYKTLKDTIVNKNISLNIKTDKNLYYIDADKSQIHQVILNLSVNASQAIPGEGDIIITTNNFVLDDLTDLECLNLKPGEYVKLRVQDTGVGISNDILSKIFEPFFTTKDTPNMKGTGLGLATSYGIVKNHGGCIDVDSVVGKGTSFSVYLPRGKIKDNINKIYSNDLKVGSGKVLVVDDEDFIRNMSSKMLKKLGYEVLVAEDGCEGVMIYQQEYKNIDLVVLDMLMPVMGGKKTFIEMKEINPDVKVLLSTGYGDQKEIQELFDFGISGYLSKPYSIKELSNEIAKIIK